MVSQSSQKLSLVCVFFLLPTVHHKLPKSSEVSFCYHVLLLRVLPEDFFQCSCSPSQLSAILVCLCLRLASLSVLLSLTSTRLMFLVLNARFISLWQALCIFTSWVGISSSSSPKLCLISVIVLGKEFPVFPFGVADPCLLLV